MKPRVAIVRGKFLNQYDMQSFEPLVLWFDITAFGSLIPFHDRFAFPTTKLWSPMDLPEFPGKMPVLNRVFCDAHYLLGLEKSLRGFDLVHTAETYYRYTQQSLDAKKRGYVKKVIATVLETIPFNNEGIAGRSGFKARARTELDHIVALTNRTKHTLIEEGTDPRKITVIHYGIDANRFHPDASWPKRLGTKKNALTILFVGRLEPYKGVGDLLAAIDMLEHDPDLSRYTVTIKFVGDGSERELLMRRNAQSRKKWHLTLESANYDQMPELYRKADLFVAPSKARTVTRFGKTVTTWEEQYGMALMEAQASGLPIVTTSSGAILENVGDAALTVAPSDSSALAQAIKAFLTSPPLRVEYGTKARARAIHVHDARISAGNMKTLYESVLGS